MSEALVTYEADGGIATLTLTAPPSQAYAPRASWSVMDSRPIPQERARRSSETGSSSPSLTKVWR